jgi:hypothetical protein
VKTAKQEIWPELMNRLGNFLFQYFGVKHPIYLAIGWFNEDLADHILIWEWTL